MNPYKLKNVFEYLTSNNQLLKKKLKLGTSEIPIPDKRPDVIDIEAINRFTKANPRVDTTNLKPLSVKHSKEPDMKAEGGRIGYSQGSVDPVADSGKKLNEVIAAYERYRGGRKNPVIKFNKFFELYAAENFAEGGRAGYEDGGMLVQPSDDGSRPGYAKVKKKDEYSRIMGLSTKELKELGFTGQKSKRIDGVKNLTDEFKSFIREQTAASPEYRKKNIQFKAREQRVINAIENAFNKNDVRHIVTKDKFNKVGTFKATDYPIITAIKKDPEKLKLISAQTNIAEDDLLNLLEDRDVFIKNKYNDVRNLSIDERTKPKKKFYASAEKWILRNSKRYADPEKFYNAFIRTFGKNNHFIKSVEAGKKTGFKIAFSDEFVENVLGLKYKSSVTSKQLKDIFKTSIYTNNPNVKKKIVDTLTDIIPTDIKFAKDFDVRNALLDNPLLKKFGINQSIKGPIAKLLADDLIDITLQDISSFRKPFLGTTQLLNYLSNRVDPKYQSMFEEAGKAVSYAQKNQWKDAKAAINLSQNIMFDHKIPQALIKLGYADDLDYIKLTPTSADFNSKIKLQQFDQPMITLANEFSRPTTSLDRKSQIVQQMKDIQNRFNLKYGDYVGSININYDNKTGTLKLTNLDPVVTKETNLVSSLGKSMVQAGEITQKKANILSAFCNRQKLQSGTGSLACSMEEIQTNMQKQIDEAAKVSKNGKIPLKFGKLRAVGGAFFGDVAIPLEYMFAAPYLAAGDIEGAKRASTAGLLGYGKVDLDKLPEGEGQRFLKHINALNSYMDNYETKTIAENDLEKSKESGTTEGRYLIEDRIAQAQTNMNTIAKDYANYGYDGQKGLLQGKVAAQQLIRDQVQSDYDKKINKATSTEFFKDSDPELLKQNILSGDEKFAPNKVTPITDLESYIRNKGEAAAGNTNLLIDVKPYVLNRAEAYGVPDIFDQYAGGYAGVETPGFIRGTGEVDMGTKSVMDAYSSLPTEYASQLAALEKKQFEEGMLKKDIEQRLTSSDPLQLASGGIASLTKTIPPESGPTPQGLPYVYNNVKKIKE